MFHKTWYPTPRPKVSTLVQKYESCIGSSPPQRLLDSSLQLQWDALESVQEELSDSEDSTSPNLSPCPNASTPVFQGSPSLTPYRPPSVVTDDEDIPMPDACPTTYEEVSPKTILAWPTPAEALVEKKRVEKLGLRQQKATKRERAKRLVRNGMARIGIAEKIQTKHGFRRARRGSTPRGSEETFVLHTPKRVLELKPSAKSRAKRAAKGAVHRVRSVPAIGASVFSRAIGYTSETTIAHVKGTRKTKSKTHRTVKGKTAVESRMSTSAPEIFKLRLRGSLAKEQKSTFQIPAVEHTCSMSEPQLRPARDEACGGIIPPPPTPSLPQPREEVQNGRCGPFISSDNCSSYPPLANRTPIDAVFIQARLADVQLEAQGTAAPMIIVTEDSDIGSWYLPINDTGQLLLRPARLWRFSSSWSPTSGPSSNGRLYPSIRNTEWCNGPVPFHLITSIPGIELDNSDNRTQGESQARYTETPLLVEFLNTELVRKSQGVKQRHRSRLWKPVGRILL